MIEVFGDEDREMSVNGVYRREEKIHENRALYKNPGTNMVNL